MVCCDQHKGFGVIEGVLHKDADRLIEAHERIKRICQVVVVAVLVNVRFLVHQEKSVLVLGQRIQRAVDRILYASALSIYEKPGVEYNLLRCDNYVFNTAGNAIDAEIKIRGIEDFMKMLRERQTRNNPKYDRLVKENSNMINEQKLKGKQNND